MTRTRRSKDPDRFRADARRRYEANKEQINQRNRAWSQRNKEWLKAYNADYYQKNRGVIRDKQRQYTQSHKPQALTRYYEWTRKNPERWQKQQKKYRVAHPEISNTIGQRRSARKRSLPDTLTAEQWQRCLDYFHHSCAVCGRDLDDTYGEVDYVLAMDHWIPLTSPNCPGTVVTNIVPLCHGKGGCNNSKGDNDPIQWVIETFDEFGGNRILTRIEGYFEWVKQQDD
jgi:hypothetical protein